MKMLADVTVINPQDGRTKNARFMVDTGSDVSAICILIAEDMGLKPVDFSSVMDADGQPIDVPVYEADIIIGKCTIRRVKLFGLDLRGTGHQGLIGSDILDRGILIRDGVSCSWQFSVDGGECYGGRSYTGYIVAGFAGLVAGAAAALLLTRK